MKHDAMTAWLPEEDILLLRLIESHGPSWKVINDSFPSRGISSIRNRYMRIKTGSRMAGRNRCQLCGELKLGHTCGVARIPPVDDDVLPSPVTEEMPPSVDTVFQVKTEVSENTIQTLQYLLSWDTVQTAHDLGFEGVTYPPLLVQGFPFDTSLPHGGVRLM
mgnify:FL=1